MHVALCYSLSLTLILYLILLLIHTSSLSQAPLRDLVVYPEEVLRRGSSLRINHTYYITKCINPALERLFRLCGVSITDWYLATSRPPPRIRRYAAVTLLHCTALRWTIIPLIFPLMSYS